MSLPEQIDAYPDCQKLFDLALSDPVGIRACFESKAKATMFQMRLHKYRSLDRAQSRRIYPRDHLRYGKSEFDELVVMLPQADPSGEWWIVIKRRGSEILAVETLSTEAPVDLSIFTPQLALPAPERSDVQ